MLLIIKDFCDFGIIRSITELRGYMPLLDKIENKIRFQTSSHDFPSFRQSQSSKKWQVVVEKLTKNVNEDHLREIFGSYGQIRDLDMPMNRQSYILYTSEADAEAAIAHMHESQIDGAVINVSIVLPRRKFSPSPPLARRDPDLCLDLDRQDATELALGLSHLDQDPLLDAEEAVEIVPVAMEVGEGEVQVIAATVVMMIEAGAGAEVVVEEEDVDTY
ncbi:hypothetical protein G7Y89_g853 [Cudoniella acicularis]|uniref:RRM domain-containing protein n=1 Tax=Cudoniella acicularis TaxID=354080 RepID=A0A8H4RXE5_9HELO|nr:hypothetical protein G7Y89_g853 [Cudoniella acicularis]